MMTWRRIGTAIASTYGAFFLLYSAPACTTGKKARGPEDNLSAEEKKKLEDYTAEIEIGRNMAGRLLKFYGTQESEELLGYVNQVGNYVASYGDFPDRRYMFEILNTETINAFACPGGYVLISMGALRHARNEAELAAVLGHEAAHVGKRHMYDTLKNMSKEDMEKAAADTRLARMPESMQVRARPRPEESDTGKLMAKLVSGGGALNFLQAARAGMSLILEQGLGADLEYEADREGVKYAIRAGYEPDAMVDFLCRMELKKRGLPEPQKRCTLPEASVAKAKVKADVLDKTHPPITQRIATVQQVLTSLNASEIIGATGKKRFDKHYAMLPPVKKAK